MPVSGRSCTVTFRIIGRQTRQLDRPYTAAFSRRSSSAGQSNRLVSGRSSVRIRPPALRAAGAPRRPPAGAVAARARHPRQQLGGRDLLGAERDGARPDPRRQVVVVALEAAARDPERRRRTRAVPRSRRRRPCGTSRSPRAGRAGSGGCGSTRTGIGPGTHLYRWVLNAAARSARMTRLRKLPGGKDEVRTSWLVALAVIGARRARERRRPRSAAPSPATTATRSRSTAGRAAVAAQHGRDGRTRTSTAADAVRGRPWRSIPPASPRETGTSFCWNTRFTNDDRTSSPTAATARTRCRSASSRDRDCTTADEHVNLQWTVGASVALGAPAGPAAHAPDTDSFSTITQQLDFTGNPGAITYEIKFAKGGVVQPDGSLSSPALKDGFLNRATGKVEIIGASEPGDYVVVARGRVRRLLHGVERAGRR